jgi:hypothetical protein
MKVLFVPSAPKAPDSGTLFLEVGRYNYAHKVPSGDLDDERTTCSTKPSYIIEYANENRWHLSNSTVINTGEGEEERGEDPKPQYPFYSTIRKEDFHLCQLLCFAISSEGPNKRGMRCSSVPVPNSIGAL